MQLARDDFEKEGIPFTKANFPKGTKFWYGGNQCEVANHWNEINQVEVLKSNCMVDIFVESQLPLYHLMKKDKTMTLNHEEIKKSIEALPGVSKEGKKSVEDILKQFGYVPPVEEVVLEPGCIYVRKRELDEPGRALAMFYIVPGSKENMKYICFHWRFNETPYGVNILRGDNLVLYARSIKDAFERLNKEGRKIAIG